MAKSNLLVKRLLFSLGILFGVLLFVSFESAVVYIYEPTNFTNFTKTNVRFTVNFTNSTDVADPNNATFYLNPNGNATQIVVGVINGTSGGSCGITGCFIIVNLTVADGNYSVNATVHNITRDIASTNASVNGSARLADSITFDATAPGVVVNVTGNAAQRGQNFSRNITINVSVSDATLSRISMIYLNITPINATGAINGTVVAQFNLTNATSNLLSLQWWSTGLNSTDTNGSVWKTDAISEGLYNITVFANDTVGNANTSVSFQVRVDRTRPPTINFTKPANGDNRSGTFVFNTSASDANSSISSIMLNITNRSGAQNTTAVVYQLIFDNNAAVITQSCTPNPVGRDEQVTCSCSGNDGTAGSTGSGVNTTTFTLHPTTSETGSIATTCTVVDLASNSLTSTYFYNVGSSGGGGSSSGGGSSGGDVVPSKKTVSTIDKITPGSAEIIKNFDKEYGLKEITILVKNPAQSVSVSVSKYDGKPAEVSVEKSGDVYKYLQIKVDNIADKLDKAIVRIQVEKSWANGKSLTKDKISMFKFINNDWKELPTTFKEEDATNYYYDVELLSFSFFAIGGKAGEAAVTPEEATTVNEPTAPAETGTTNNKAVTGVIIGIVVLIIIVVVVFFIYSKKKRKW